MENTEIMQEEPIFKVKYRITESDNKEFQKFMTLKYRMGTLIVVTVIEIILIYYTINASLGGSWLWWVFIPAAVLIPVSMITQTNRNSAKNKSIIGCESIYLFYKDFFVNIFNNKEIAINFTNCEAYETEKNFYIVVNKREGFVIGKDGFETGTAEDFTEYLKEKLCEKFIVCKK